VCSRARALAFVPACVWCDEGVGVVGGRFDVHVFVGVCVGEWGWVSACWCIRGSSWGAQHRVVTRVCALL
jgi:hypothetical protein